MDRIRTGLTGLAAVFLVTAAASLLFAPDAEEQVKAELAKPGEPLAQLGVAPSNEKSSDEAQAARQQGAGNGQAAPGAPPTSSPASGPLRTHGDSGPDAAVTI